MNHSYFVLNNDLKPNCFNMINISLNLATKYYPIWLYSRLSYVQFRKKRYALHAVSQNFRQRWLSNGSNFRVIDNDPLTVVSIILFIFVAVAVSFYMCIYYYSLDTPVFPLISGMFGNGSLLPFSRSDPPPPPPQWFKELRGSQGNWY